MRLLHAQIARALDAPDVKERFAALALDVAALGPDDFRKVIETDVQRWREVVAKSGIRIE